MGLYNVSVINPRKDLISVKAMSLNIFNTLI
jgi:hypothetical protein